MPIDDERERCKHIARVQYATDERPVPSWVSSAAVDPLLGEHVGCTPVVAADGGVTVTDESVVESEGGECDDCIRNDDGELVAPCFSCYAAGVEFPDDG